MSEARLQDEAHFRYSTLRYAPVLAHKYYIRLVRPASNKH
jgi:hypothetical protein